MHEKGVELKVVKWAIENGVYTRKFVSPSRRGVPDRVFIYRGKAVFIEFKTPVGRLSALQSFEIRELIYAGATACVMHDSDSAIRLLASTFILCT